MITDAAHLVEEPILNLCPGMRYPIKCQQTGQTRSNTVTAPVFAVRNGDNGQIEIIESDNSNYDFCSGKLDRTGYIPHQNFYLVIDEITMDDNDKQFVCLNKADVGYVGEEFSDFHTTIVVHSDEGKEIQLHM